MDLLMLMAILGLLLGFGLLYFVPYVQHIKKIVGILAVIVFLGMTLAYLGLDQVNTFVNNWPNLVALAVSMIAGTSIAAMIGR